MYDLKAFSTIETLVSNIDGEVAPIGELSTFSTTFSKDKKIYPSSLNSHVTIHAFSSNSDILGKTTPPMVLINLSHIILDWIYTRQLASTVIETNQSFLSALVTQFTTQCDGIVCGDLVNAINGKQFPQWISFRSRAYANTEDNIITIWLSDQSFRQKYDNYEITVIPPVDNLAIFFGSQTTVSTEVNSVTHVDKLDDIQRARGENPETVIVGVSYNWVDPSNSNNRINTNWTVLVYGSNGNDADVIREAIAQHLLNNSTYTAAQWRTVFPDIFRRTEFLIFPRWHNYAIPNMTLQAGIYSPLTIANREINYLKEILNDYSEDFIKNHTTIMPHPYKCLALDVIGGYDNKENLFKISQVFPDIINVSSTSPDYNRMSASTQELLTKLTNMLLIAESINNYSDIPTGYRKVVRYGILFITVRHMNIEFLVSSKLTTPHY